MENGYTVSPVPTEDAAGNISYHFDVQDNSYVSQGNEIINEDDGYYEDENGDIHHILENVDYEGLEHLDEDYVPELTQDDFFTDITPEDGVYLVDLVGGAEEYTGMISWARQNLNPNASARFNQILTSGEVDVIEESILSLYNLYQQNSDAVAPVNRNSQNEERVPQPSREDQQTTYALQSIVGGSENYNQLLNLARENFSEDQIDRYNQVMDMGTNEDRATAVRWLAQQFN